MSRRLLIALILALLAIGLSQIPAHAACSGVQVPNTANLNVVVTKYPAGTTFCLQAGTYEVSGTPVPFDIGDKFIGVPAVKNPNWTKYSESFWSTPPSTRIVSTDGVPPFRRSGGGTGATVFRYLDISGANSKSGYIGQGIGGGGALLDIDLVRIHHNEGPAISAWSGPINDSEIDHNGYVTGEGGLKSVSGRASFDAGFYHDNGATMQCDGCIVSSGDGPFSVTNSRIVRTQRVGIKSEISDVSVVFSG